MITDRVYLADAARATKLQAAVTQSPVYFYLFGYRGKHSFTEVNSGTTNNYGKIVATPAVTQCSWVSTASFPWKVLTNISEYKKAAVYTVVFLIPHDMGCHFWLRPLKQRCRIDFWNYSTLYKRMIVRVTVNREDAVGLQAMGRGAYYSSHSQSFTSSRICRFQFVCKFVFSGDWTQKPLSESSVLQPKTIRYPFSCSYNMLEFFKTVYFVH